MTSWSTVIDRGREELLVYPVIEMSDRRGNTGLHPDFDNPVRIPVTTSEERSRIADLPGEVEIEVIRCVTRSFPRGIKHTWSRVYLNGNEYDLAEPPRESRGTSRAINHFEFRLRSRANIGVGEREHEDPKAVPVIRRETR